MITRDQIKATVLEKPKYCRLLMAKYELSDISDLWDILQCHHYETVDALISDIKSLETQESIKKTLDDMGIPYRQIEPGEQGGVFVTDDAGHRYKYDTFISDNVPDNPCIGCTKFAESCRCSCEMYQVYDAFIQDVKAKHGEKFAAYAISLATARAHIKNYTRLEKKYKDVLDFVECDSKGHI